MRYILLSSDARPCRGADITSRIRKSAVNRTATSVDILHKLSAPSKYFIVCHLPLFRRGKRLLFRITADGKHESLKSRTRNSTFAENGTQMHGTQMQSTQTTNHHHAATNRNSSKNYWLAAANVSQQKRLNGFFPEHQSLSASELQRDYSLLTTGSLNPLLFIYSRGEGGASDSIQQRKSLPQATQSVISCRVHATC